MQLGTAQILVELIDNDDGDLGFISEQGAQLWEYLQERLISFKYFDRVKGKDRAEMTFRNEDYEMLDNPVFAKGQKLLMSWGWIGHMTTPRRVVVQKIKGRSEVVVTCHCMLSLLDKEKVSRFLDNATDSEFVRWVAEEYGYTGNFLHIDETKVRRDISQNYTTDARFLNRLARRNRFDFYIDSTGLHWHKRKTKATPTKTFIYKTDPVAGGIIEPPQFDVNLTKAIAKVKVVARDPRTKREVVAYGGPNDTEIDSLGFEEEMGDPDDTNQGRRAGRMARVDVRSGGLMTQEEAQAEADARYLETAKKKYKMTMTIDGDPLLGAKHLIDLWGTADIMDGFYFLTEVVHTVEAGTFTQELKGKKDAVNKVPTRKKIARKKRTNTAIRLEDTTIYGDTQPALNRVLTVRPNANGDFVPAWTFAEGEGRNTVFADLGPEELDQLSDATLARLSQLGAQTAQPDADK